MSGAFCAPDIIGIASNKLLPYQLKNVIVIVVQNQKLKTVVIVGRPNVGKSTLFNRLIGKRKAIETDVPGTTRDRLYGEVFWRREKFSIVDLPGIEKQTRSEISKNIQEGIDFALRTADLILFVVDWNEPDNQIDRNIARRLLKTKKEIILVVNKADNVERIHQSEPFRRLGTFPSMVPISAINGKNTGDLLDEVVSKLEFSKKNIETPKEDIRLAIIGRPNVGKSTLLNQIVGEKRSVVSDEAGTTRDIVDAVVSVGNKKIRIIDTAGLRRKGKVVRGSVEDYSVLRSTSALKECDLAILIIDAEEGLVAREESILGQAKEWGKGVILAVNKIDLSDKDRNEFMAEKLYALKEKLNFAPWLPVVFISAKEKENINSLMKQVIKVSENRKTLIPEEDLAEIVKFIKENNNQLFWLKSIRQKKTNPPTFLLKNSTKKKPHFTHLRYIENKIRDAYPMEGTPIFLDL